jgi:hypothetical protein
MILCDSINTYTIAELIERDWIDIDLWKACKASHVFHATAQNACIPALLCLARVPTKQPTRVTRYSIQSD